MQLILHSAANCVVVDDLTGDGVNDMILARDNGSVQVWSLGGNAGDEGFREENFGGASRGERIRKCAEYDIGESVRSLDIGVMSTPGFDELVVCTYSGRIVSLTTEPLSDAAIDDKYGRTKAVVGKETQVKAFRAELKELQKQVSKETEKLQKARGDSDEGKSKSKSSRGDKDGSGNSSGKHMFTASKFSVNHSFELMERDATYQLVLEIPFPIISVVLQTDVPVDLLRQDVSTSVIMSPTRSLILGDARGTKHDIHNNPGSAKTNDDRTTEAHQVLATYRPTDDKMRRIKIGLRSVEGQHGVLNAYVVSGGDSKTAHAVRLSIKPLSMHARIKDITPQQESSIPWNTLSFNGDFSISQAHSWVSFCLPALPPHFTSARGADGREQARLCFINAFVKSHLLVTYEDSDLTFKSDSVTTITILKQVITKHATNLGLKVRISTDLNRDSVPHFLRLLNPKMQAQFQLSRQMQLARAMSEITEFGDDASYLDPELQYVVKNREAIKEAFDESKRVLEILYGMVTDLYIDVKQQISGQSSASAQVPLLMQLLKEYQIDDVADFVLKAFR